MILYSIMDECNHFSGYKLNGVTSGVSQYPTMPSSILFLVTGFGLAFNLQPALTMIGRYFYKNRPIANGFAMAGSPVFLSTLAPLNQYLINEYGWRGSFRILGGLLLNCCVAGSLMRPLKAPPNTAKALEEKPAMVKGDLLCSF